MPKIVHTGPEIHPTSHPFSQVVEANGFVFLAGQAGITQDGALIAGGIEPETRQTLDNIGRLLRAVGLDYSDVVRATVYLVDIGDYEILNSVYGEYFPDDAPTRVTVAVDRLAGDLLVEIEVMAAR